MLKSLAIRRRAAIALPAWWPACGYAALAVVLPLFWYPAQLPLLTLAALPVLPALALAAWRMRGRPFVRGPLELPLVFVLLATCLAAAPVADWALGLPKLLGMALGAVTAVVLTHTIRTARDLAVGLLALALLTFGLSVFGLVAVDWTVGKASLLDPVYARLPLLVHGFVPNSPSGAIHPNELAGVLVLLVPAVLARGIGLSRRPMTTAASIYLAIGLAGLVALVLTQSRSGLVAIAVAVAVLGGRLVFHHSTRQGAPGWLRVGVPVGYVGLVLGLTWAIWQVVHRWLEGGTNELVLDTFQGRLEVWGRALYMLQDVPFTGIGIGQFNLVLQALYPTFLASPARVVPHAHNVYLAYAVELGVPGALAFAVLVGASLRQSARAIRTNDAGVSWAGFGLALGVMSFLIYGVTDAIAPGARAGLVLWLVLGLAAAAGRISTDAQLTRQALHSRRATPSGESP